MHGTTIEKGKSYPRYYHQLNCDKSSCYCRASGYKGDITFNGSLYAAGPQAYIDVLHDLSDKHVRVLIIGHNPGLEELVEMLTGEIHLMPTCSLAHVKLRVGKWSDIDNKIKGQVAQIWRPRDLT
jgi:phosphohistidine phosphatase